jgi:metal-responsive CopG/Arc/MetJ family transcriptional regulator
MDYMPTDSPEKQLVHMLIDQPLLKRLDDFRFKHRFESRSEAARWLLNWALDQRPKPEVERP